MRIVLGVDFSGGHLYPALAFAKALKKDCRKRVEIIFCGAKKSQKAAIRKEGFFSVGFDFSFRQALLEGFLRFWEAIYILLRYRPQKIYGFGGRNSFWLVMFASFFVPTYIYEPNVVFGRANRILAFFCRQVFRGLGEAAGKKQVKAGVPLRDSFFLLKDTSSFCRQQLGLEEDENIFTVLVFGGSLGASSINKLVVSALKFLKPAKDSFQFIHLSGRKDFVWVKRAYQQEEFRCAAFAFYENMEVLYKACDLAVCRAGASTLSEINYFSLPALVIPYPYAGSHQKANASFLQKRSCIIMEEEKHLTPKKLAGFLIKARAEEKIRKELVFSQRKVKLWAKAEEFCLALWP